MRNLTGRADVPILIDQEGGRVARMRPPEWPAFPSGGALRAALRGRAVVGDRGGAVERSRAGADASVVRHQRRTPCHCSTSGRKAQPTSSATARLDRSRCRSRRSAAPCSTACASAGVVGIVKHMPGHGRALVDSHKELPVVTASAEELEVDLEPFERLASAPMGMTAHVVYTAWDPDRPGEPVAGRHPRDHPRPDRLRRLADERRHRHGGASGRLRQPCCGRRRGRLRRRPSLLRQDGRNGCGRQRRSGDERRKAKRVWPAPWRRRCSSRNASTSPKKSPSATRCSRSSDPALVDRNRPFVDVVGCG